MIKLKKYKWEQKANVSYQLNIILLADEDIKQAKNIALVEQLIKHHILGLMPNISKTGIMDVDEPRKETNDPFANFSL